MIDIRLYDTNFAHHPAGSSLCSFPGRMINPTYIRWIKDYAQNTKFAFFTDNCLNEVDNCNAQYKFAWLLEPRELIPEVYARISEPLLYNKFEKILTYDKDLLDLNSEKFQQYVFGGCWIPPEEQRIYDKTQNVCIIASYKRQLPGHVLRHQIVGSLSGRHNISVYGNGYRAFENTSDILRHFRYCIVVENTARNFWVTEKLIQCYRTGTIPIYWGTNFNSFFGFSNNHGIYRFDTIQQLDEMLSMMNEDLYNTNLIDGNVHANFEIAGRYAITEDHIYSEILRRYE